MTPASTSGKVVVVSCGWYMFKSFCSLAFGIGEMRRLSKAWRSTVSKDVEWEVISNAPVATASGSGLVG